MTILTILYVWITLSILFAWGWKRFQDRMKQLDGE